MFFLLFLLTVQPAVAREVFEFRAFSIPHVARSFMIEKRRKRIYTVRNDRGDLVFLIKYRGQPGRGYFLYDGEMVRGKYVAMSTVGRRVTIQWNRAGELYKTVIYMENGRCFTDSLITGPKKRA